MEEVDSLREYPEDSALMETLKLIAEHLIEAEAHHQREEQVLFPALEKKGITGPPRIMVLEHEELRRYKHELRELTEKAGELGFDEFRERLSTSAHAVIHVLRDHIFKENHILYPTAVKVIESEAAWREMKTRCNEIGYCCFTPKV